MIPSVPTGALTIDQLKMILVASVVTDISFQLSATEISLKKRIEPVPTPQDSEVPEQIRVVFDRRSDCKSVTTAKYIE